MALVEVRGLRKTYASAGVEVPFVLAIEEFSLEEGELLALRGASGCGKTTFLHLLAGISSADAGTITIDGIDVTGLSEGARDVFRARTVGYVFQTFNLMQGLTALENVELAMRFGGGVDRGRARALLDRVGLANRAEYRPRQLSVGQQQRVAVARALANQPRLVLADEPTGNLDTAAAAETLELLREACRDSRAALLLVTHDREVLEQFERVRDFDELHDAAAATGGAA